MSKIPEIRGQFEILRQDILARHLIQIDNPHARIHQGSYFHITDIDTDVDMAVPKQYLFITPNRQTRMHFTFCIESQPGIKVELYEDTTVSSNGNALTIINNRRDITDTSEMLAFADPTVTVDGTLLYARQSGNVFYLQLTDEFILDVNSKYQIKITSLADNTAVSTYCSWYELR